MKGTYDLGLVVLSYVVAVLASYVALNLASRVFAAHGRARAYWLAAGAVALGAGIWAMHLVGMLALQLAVTVSYDASTALVSMAIAVAASGVALFLIERDQVSPGRLAASAAVMGLGINSMHYMGVAAMRVSPAVEFDGLPYAASLLIATGASFIALSITYRQRSDNVAHAALRRFGGALVLGAAIAGMHYTGIAAARFDPDLVALPAAPGIGNLWLPEAIAACVVAFLAITMMISVFDSLHASSSTRIARALEDANERLRQIYNAMPGAVILFDRAGVISSVNDAATRLLGYTPHELVGQPLSTVFVAGDVRPVSRFKTQSLEDAVVRSEELCRARSGEHIPVQCSAARIRHALHGEHEFICVALDIREQKELEVGLRQAQKLESVGRLAAGIAHEINTPVQFVGDSIHFVQEACTGLERLIDAYGEALRENGGPEAREGIARLEQEIDLAYLRENVPKSLTRALEGVDRVAAIVRAMKEFAHPDQKEMLPVDLNQAILNTLTIARNEYRYVADVETDLGELPRVVCYPGEVNQAILNIVVNAAHAIGDVVRGTDRRGLIRVSTRRAGDDVVVSISDTGGGIPAAVRERIFDPFFTTKEVGKGTGQGLAIARTVVREKHGGDLTFDSRIGTGTTFHMRLPIKGNVPEDSRATVEAAA